MAIIKQQFTITYEREVDTDTGEIIKTTIIGSSDIKSEKKKAIKKDQDIEAKVYLEDNKLKLNSLAVEMLNVDPGDRIDIQYSDTYPIIGKSESFGNPEGGTKLTKSYTISFRGKKSEVLQKFGTEFKVIDSNGRFILDSGKEVIQEPVKDENVNIEDIDLNLDDLLDDADAKEVKSSIFKL
jgi:hypothetical protein